MKKEWVNNKEHQEDVDRLQVVDHPVEDLQEEMMTDKVDIKDQKEIVDLFLNLQVEKEEILIAKKKPQETTCLFQDFQRAKKEQVLSVQLEHQEVKAKASVAKEHQEEKVKVSDVAEPQEVVNPQDFQEAKDQVQIVQLELQEGKVLFRREMVKVSAVADLQEAKDQVLIVRLELQEKKVLFLEGKEKAIVTATEHQELPEL
jgi:hypothetical protein